MVNTMELRQKAKKKIDEARALHEAAVKESRAMNEDEQKRYDTLMAEIDSIKADIAREERLQALEMNAPAPPDRMAPGEVRDMGEFYYLARFEPQRLRDLSDGKEHRDMSMGVGATGGFFVPEQLGPALRPIGGGGSVIRPRAMVIPAGDPPDAAITFPALNQGGANGRYGGVQVTWIGEGAAKPQTEPIIREVKLEPHEVACHVIVNDKLLRNRGAAGPFVSALLARAIMGAEEQAFLNGGGVGQPAGIIGHPASINVVRAGAGAVAYADLTGMKTQLVSETGSPVWICSQTILGQLMNMVTPLGQLVWQPSAREGMPMTLLGWPLIVNPRSPVLGAQGDLILADLSYYLIKDGSPLTIAASEHPLFVQNKTIIKAFWNVDGQPALNGPMLLEDGVTQVSPFVVLQ